jgi:hypothetical protein
VDPESLSMSQMEDQAQEISILRDGFPAEVKPSDDHLAHSQTLLGYLQKQAATGQPFDPVAKQRIDEHLMAHLQALQQVNPKAHKQLMQQMGGQGGPPQ